ncbi:YcnI family protein [Streptomyces cinnabarinus]|uniref:YcnI family protein n=1 Tax=Streptomyces cinnabarinus TaxID=67287 RepID=A0ABY7KE33_9ACTN|nr:YcnI family protein [Streptomyces cinnabarinus]WAZ22785.1 YcnI family protein [Streptomyces cinnabarinus]
MKISSRIAAVGALAGTAVLALSAPALAHVTVQPEGEAAKGGYAVVDFRVPNESDTASTVKLEVSFPADHPLASARPEPIAGWTAKITKAELDEPIELHGQKIDEAVSKITWTATGKGIEPGFFQKFAVSMGALPEDTDELVFKAVQTYDDDEVARWIEVPQEGEEEPEKPAPVLTLSAASEDGHHGSGASEEPSDDASPAAATTTADESGSDGTDTTARVLGVVGIVVGALGVAYGVLAGRRRTNA